MIVCSALLAASTAVTAMRKSLDAEADWTMERRLAGSGRVLASAGEVKTSPGEGIFWHVITPFESSVTMNTNMMVFADEDGCRIKPLSEMPHYEAIRKATDAFAAGDGDAFDGMFEMEERSLEGGGWIMTLTPDAAAMKRLFESVEISGAEFPTNVVMKSADGGVSTIRFRRRQSVR